jgi:hypothetical protein
MKTKTTVVMLAASFVLLAGATAEARGGRQMQRGRSWVPQGAWNAVKQRARSDMQNHQVKLYKSGWSRAQSRGLVSAGNQDAYIVHAKSIGPRRGPGVPKSKGSYLVQKSRQGIWEAYPLAPASGWKHISKVDARRGVSITAYADGAFPPSKIVHGAKVQNAQSVGSQLGQIVASKQHRDGSQTVYALGAPNKGGRGAAAQLKMMPRDLPNYQQAGQPGNGHGGRIMPLPPATWTYTNIHFNQMVRRASSRGAHAGGQQGGGQQ